MLVYLYLGSNNPLLCYSPPVSEYLQRTQHILYVCLHRVCSKLHACSQACTNNSAQEQQKETRRCKEHFQSCDSEIHRTPFWSTNTSVHRNRTREMTARWKRHFGSYFQHSEISTAVVSGITMVTEDYLLLHNWGCALKPTG